MDELSYRLHLLDSTLKKTNLICNTCVAKLIHPESEVCNSREGYRSEEVSVRVNDQSISVAVSDWPNTKQKQILYLQGKS